MCSYSFCALFCFDEMLLLYPYTSGLLHWIWDNCLSTIEVTLTDIGKIGCYKTRQCANCEYNLWDVLGATVWNCCINIRDRPTFVWGGRGALWNCLLIYHNDKHHGLSKHRQNVRLFNSLFVLIATQNTKSLYYLAFVRGTHRSQWILLTKGQ